MTTPNYTNLNGGAIQEQSIKKNYPEFHKYLIETYPLDLPFKEKLYWYFKGLTDYPRCPICGRVPKFENIKSGYRTYCSAKCMNSDPLKKEKTRNTCLKKYGVDVPSKSEIFKWKTKQTSFEKYGVENAMQNKDVAKKSHNTNIERYGGMGNSSKILLEKSKQTMLKRYGVENPGQSEELRKKARKTLLERRGVDHQSKLIEVRDKISKSRKLNTLTKYDDVITWQDEQWLCKCPNSSCNKCQEKTYLVPPSIYRDRKRDHTERCTKLLKVCHTTTEGTTIELFIRNILDEYNIEYRTNVRDLGIWDRKELDIYIPSKNIGIECNGIQSHCAIQVGQSYHYRKYYGCQQKNIQLLTLWHDWIYNKPDIVKSILLSKLGIYDKRLYARRCRVQTISSSVCNKFLDDNHIQGAVRSNVRYGLYFEDNLVSVMTFSSVVRNKVVRWELSRFATLQGTQVIGGAKKLLTHFIREYHPSQIISFSSNDISTGHLYETLGFAKGPINQSYWYIDIKSMTRYHRSTFTKDSIVKRGWKPNKDGWKETDVMYEHGYYQIYDSGQTKWALAL